MLYYFRRYPLSLVIMAVIFYLSFFTPPKSNLEEIPNIDKLVHVCMYGGLCSILWFEYLRTHRMINWSHILWGGILAPIAMSGCIELMQTYLTTNRCIECCLSYIKKVFVWCKYRQTIICSYFYYVK